VDYLQVFGIAGLALLAAMTQPGNQVYTQTPSAFFPQPPRKKWMDE